METLGRVVILITAIFINYSLGDVLSNTLDTSNEIKDNHNDIKSKHHVAIHGNTLPPLPSTPSGPDPCTCGIFLSGQFIRGNPAPPKGNPALLQDVIDPVPCNAYGNKQCTNKCLDTIVKHLPNSPAIICGTIDRDCYKERAYLFIKNCNNTWVNTNLSAGREYCCKDGMPIKCSLMS